MRAGEVLIDSLTVAVLNADAAVVSAYATDTWTDTSGHIDRFRERMTYVWTRTTGGWRILHFHNSEAPDSLRQP